MASWVAPCGCTVGSDMNDGCILLARPCESHARLLQEEMKALAERMLEKTRHAEA